jgi:hypothetical protein
LLNICLLAEVAVDGLPQAVAAVLFKAWPGSRKALLTL